MKVISFSLWGINPKYSVGMVRNAELAAKIYPDWECWVYFPRHGEFGPKETFVLYDMPNVRMIPMNAEANWKGMFWRFLPADDQFVEAMISRDCDSRLSYREKAAVDEWLASDARFHIMHDHPYHSVPILGGMWGVKYGALADIKEIMADWKQEDRWQTDQEFLQSIVWPRMQGDYMNHDDGFWTHVWDGKPFPKARQGLEFVGQVFDEHENTVSEHLAVLAKSL